MGSKCDNPFTHCFNFHHRGTIILQQLKNGKRKTALPPGIKDYVN